MTPPKPFIVALGALAALAMLTGCSSEIEACKNGVKIEMEDLNDTTAMAALMKDLVPVAPEDLKEDWTYLSEVYDKLIGIDVHDGQAVLDAVGSMSLLRFNDTARALPAQLEELCNQ